MNIDATHLTSLFEHAAEGIILTDDGGRIILINPAAQRLLGYSKNEVITHRKKIRHLMKILPTYPLPILRMIYLMFLVKVLAEVIVYTGVMWDLFMMLQQPIQVMHLP